MLDKFYHFQKGARFVKSKGKVKKHIILLYEQMLWSSADTFVFLSTLKTTSLENCIFSVTISLAYRERG